MTQLEMRSLKDGDIVQDNEMTKEFGEVVLCKVFDIDETGFALTSINNKFKNSYPHRFSYGIDSSKLGKVEIK